MRPWSSWRIARKRNACSVHRSAVVHQLARERPRSRGVIGRGKVEREQRDAARSEAGIVVAPMLDSANEHSGVDEKEKTDRDLNRQQTPSERPAGSRSCRPIVGRLEDRRHVLARRVQRWSEPARQAGRHDDTECREQHTAALGSKCQDSGPLISSHQPARQLERYEYSNRAACRARAGIPR